MTRVLTDKVAVVYGAGGAVGGAIAHAFAREGARVYASGRTLESAQKVVEEIIAAGGTAESAQVDALDEQAVDRHAAGVAEKEGGIDVSINAIGFAAVQGTPLTELAHSDFAFPIATWTSTQFLTARAAARHMVPNRRGVILTLSASPARGAIAGAGGFGAACAAIEGLTRTLAADLAPHGVRVVGLRPHRIGDSHFGEDFEADPRAGAEFRQWLEDMTLLKRLPTLDEVANTAVFLASDDARSMTGVVADLTAGMSVD
jgi:NAD(P)-dependent dehydrogenase (short-subunit alcohol dehydrogenase family)